MGNIDLGSIFHTVGEYIQNLPEILNALFKDDQQ
jgi:hypothetical protein